MTRKCSPLDVRDSRLAGVEEWDSGHRAVITALRQLRANNEALSLATFARQAVLVGLCGDADPLDAFLAFRGELQRWARGSRNEAAYAWSMLAPGDGVLDRLTAAAERVRGGFGADQRDPTLGRRYPSGPSNPVPRHLTDSRTARPHAAQRRSDRRSLPVTLPDVGCPESSGHPGAAAAGQRVASRGRRCTD